MQNTPIVHPPQAQTRLTCSSLVALLGVLRTRDMLHPHQVGELVDEIEVVAGELVAGLRARVVGALVAQAHLQRAGAHGNALGAR